MLDVSQQAVLTVILLDNEFVVLCLKNRPDHLGIQNQILLPDIMLVTMTQSSSVHRQSLLRLPQLDLEM